MTSCPLTRVVHHLRRAASVRDANALSDGELLGRFVAGRDETAFALLVQRHGPMVLGVCRRVLGNVHDAEDAFQATFLVLVRRATSVLPRDLVGNWLYGVAYRTALEARTTRARRKLKEVQVSVRPGVQDTCDVAAEREELARLDRELAQLPDRYRAAIVLCDLEGKTHREAARLLGCPEKTLSTRLLRARKRLAQRLGGSLAAVLSTEAARANVAVPLVHSTIEAALAVAAGQAADAVASARVAGLAEGVVKSMLLNRLKTLAVVLGVLGLLALGAGFLPHAVRAEKVSPAATTFWSIPVEKAPAESQEGILRELETVRWSLLHVDTDRRTLHVSDASVFGSGAFDKGSHMASWMMSTANCQVAVHGLPVAKDARIQLDGKEAGFKDLHAGMQLKLRFAGDKLSITSIEASLPTLGGYVLKAVDIEKRTITLALSRDGKPQVLPVAKQLLVDLAHHGNVGLEHLKPGMHVSLFLDVEEGKLVVARITAVP